MAREQSRNSWPEQVRRWLTRRLRASRLTSYPDYVTCPYCEEPEVEVWSEDQKVRCHNCGLSFESNGL